MQEAIRHQMGAAIESLAATVRACPDTTWYAGRRWFQPWYIAYHATYWLAWYLAEGPADFAPPPPFTNSELDEDVLPPRPWSRDELLGWLKQMPAALDARLASLGDAASLARRVATPWGEASAWEVVLYGLRHVEHHTGQLNLLVRSAGSKPAAWVQRSAAPTHVV
ncbi:MAG: DinB family protein [Planctomycetes bacterium]|nr:DinB family protein [Planctomycetota bacterium]MCB9828276.1 DinB family protein [Planctomycetota bacterium]MCB9901411.1 DinB family protein [Planctomycetota bacterium]